MALEVFALSLLLLLSLLLAQNWQVWPLLRQYTSSKQYLTTGQSPTSRSPGMQTSFLASAPFLHRLVVYHWLIGSLYSPSFGRKAKFGGCQCISFRSRNPRRSDSCCSACPKRSDIDLCPVCWQCVHIRCI